MQHFYSFTKRLFLKRSLSVSKLLLAEIINEGMDRGVGGVQASAVVLQLLEAIQNAAAFEYFFRILFCRFILI